MSFFQNTEQGASDQNMLPEVEAESCDNPSKTDENEQPTEAKEENTVAAAGNQQQPKTGENGSSCCRNDEPSPGSAEVNAENQENSVQATDENAANKAIGEKQEKLGPVSDFDMIPLRTTEKKTVDFRHKTYLAPLTTVSLVYEIFI